MEPRNLAVLADTTLRELPEVSFLDVSLEVEVPRKLPAEAVSVIAGAVRLPNIIRPSVLEEERLREPERQVISPSRVSVLEVE